MTFSSLARIENTDNYDLSLHQPIYTKELNQNMDLNNKFLVHDADLLWVHELGGRGSPATTVVLS